MPHSISMLEDDEGNKLFFFNNKIDLDKLPPVQKARWQTKLQHNLCHVVPIRYPDETVH